MNRYRYFESKSAAPPSGGIRARSRRGAFGETRWSKALVALIDRALSSGRRARGRAYARNGHVLALAQDVGVVRATVQGTGRTPYEVTLRVKAFDDKVWDRVEIILAQGPKAAAQLQGGKLPDGAEAAFEGAGVSLVPKAWEEFDTHCTCYDRERPCKHIAAAFYIMVEKMERDPLWLFALLGRSRELFLANLRQRRSEPNKGVSRGHAPLGQCLKTYWRAEREEVKKLLLELETPAIPSMLRQIGPAPMSLHNSNLVELLTPAYARFIAEGKVLLEEDCALPEIKLKPSTSRRSEGRGRSSGSDAESDGGRGGRRSSGEGRGRRGAASGNGDESGDERRGRNGRQRRSRRDAQASSGSDGATDAGSSQDAQNGSKDGGGLSAHQLLMHPKQLPEGDIDALRMLSGAVCRKLRKLGALERSGRSLSNADRVACLERLYDVMDNNQRARAFANFVASTGRSRRGSNNPNNRRLWRDKRALMRRLHGANRDTLDRCIVDTWTCMMDHMSLRQFHRAVRGQVRRREQKSQESGSQDASAREESSGRSSNSNGRGSGGRGSGGRRSNGRRSGGRGAGGRGSHGRGSDRRGGSGGQDASAAPQSQSDTSTSA